MEECQNILEIRNLKKSYMINKENSLQVLKGLNISIGSGEMVALMGASGCGKTTLINLICGIDKADSGSIMIDHEEITKMRRSKMAVFRRNNIGLIFQDFNLLESLNVKDNILLPLILENRIEDSEEKLKQIAEVLSIADIMGKSVTDISGGQKQRVAMARMIASEPDILLLDEPFSALDSYLKWELEQEMRDMLAEVQKPVLFVSHNRDEVYRLCSVVSCIDHGKMEVIEKTKEFFHNPKTKTAAVLSGCKNISAAEIVDNNHIKALGWGITLCVSEIPEETKAVGIRAHSFYPVNAEQISGKESAANESRVSVIQEGTGFKTERIYDPGEELPLQAGRDRYYREGWKIFRVYRGEIPRQRLGWFFTGSHRPQEGHADPECSDVLSVFPSTSGGDSVPV